nr:EOG090X0ECZ [Eulimnadia texana]
MNQNQDSSNEFQSLATAFAYVFGVITSQDLARETGPALMKSINNCFQHFYIKFELILIDSCGNVNFARRTACNRCGKEKEVVKEKVKKLGHEIGKEAAEKSKGLFSADDWMCNKCGNVNWARRSQCNVCNAPKFGEVEERTGYGGGYNERENVEYIEREDSDGEYDEFGRRKKKFRSAKKDGEEDSEKETKEEVKKNEDEEEEDDDDDDDGDLSKYDLDGWGDEDEASNDKPAKKEENEKSNDKKETARREEKRSYKSGRSRDRRRR